MKIFLTGMPGCGKSTFGKRVSDELSLGFFDLDKEIIIREGCSINEIFESRGEAYFRKVESGLLKNITAENDNFIMAAGGGAPCFFDNMEFMNQNGITIYIKAGINDLLERLSRKGINKRPLLKDLKAEDLHLELTEKLNSRKLFYEKAGHVILYNPDLDKDIIKIIRDS